MPRLNLGLDDQNVITGVLRIADIAVVAGTSVVAYVLHHGIKPLPDQYVVAIVVAGLLTANFMHVSNVYRFSDLRRFSVQLGGITSSCIGIAVALLLLAYFGKVSENFSRAWALYWVISAFVSLLTLHGLIVLLFNAWRDSGRLTYNIAVIGAGEEGARLWRYLNERSQSGVRIVGMFDDRQSRIDESIDREELKGNTDDLLLFMRQHRVDQITIALPWYATARIAEIIDRLKTGATDVSVCPDAAAFELPNLGYEVVAGVPMLTLQKPPLRGWNRILKGLEDRILSFLILCLIWPVLLVIAIAVRMDSPGPVLFRQKRYGFNNNVITVLKFRTMYWKGTETDGGDVPQAKREDPRITRVGRFLRRTSLDELPQLFNVLSGEMSLVGPRPHAVAHNEEYAKIIDGYLVRHRVKPGITGWAQVNGLRGETQSPDLMRQRVQHDLDYIENWSLRFDLKILILTMFIGFTGKNAY